METTAETSDSRAATKHPESGSQPGRPPILLRGQIYSGALPGNPAGMSLDNSFPLAALERPWTLPRPALRKGIYHWSRASPEDIRARPAGERKHLCRKTR